MNLKDRLYNAEQTPPPNVWDKITTALDESHIADQFPSKLYNAEATVPAAAWDKITEALDAEDTPVIPMRRKSPVFVRYAAAIAVLLVITFGIVKWNSNTESADPGKVASSKDTTVPGNKPLINPSETNVAVNSGTEEYDTAEESPVTISTAQVKTAAYIRKQKTNYNFSEDVGSAIAMYAYNEPAQNLSDRYVMLMTPNGIVRMSKKLGDIICCVAGEEQDDECKDQIKRWQEKLATSPGAASAGNFLDILNMVSSLNEPEL